MKITTHYATSKQCMKSMALDIVSLIFEIQVIHTWMTSGQTFKFYYPPKGSIVTVRSVEDGEFSLGEDTLVILKTDGTLSVEVGISTLIVPCVFLSRFSSGCQHIFELTDDPQDWAVLLQICLGFVPKSVITTNVGETAAADLAKWNDHISKYASHLIKADGLIDLHVFYCWKYLQLQPQNGKAESDWG